MFPSWIGWSLAALAALAGLGLLLRRALRRWFFRQALKTRRELGYRLNLVTFTRKQRLMAELLHDPPLQDYIRRQAAATGAEEGDLVAQATEYLDEIIPAFDLVATFRFGRRVAGGLLRFLYRVRIGRSAEAELARIPRSASVVYVMNHRSNVDYLLVGYLLSDRVAISYAVGEWARVWPLETIFKSFGSFFIRRKFRDPLYHMVLERYVQRAVASGITQGIFLEGGLSRDGALQKPKAGLLDYMLRSGAKELVFIPVGLNFDRVLEDANLVREAAGLPRRGFLGTLRRSAFWTLGLAWRGAKGRFHRFGYAVADFGAPLCARELLDLDAFAALPWPERKAQVEAVAARLLEASAREVPITPVALVAFAWRSLGAERIEEAALRGRALELAALAEARGLPLYLARGSAERVVEAGLRVLRLRDVLRAEGDALAAAPERAALVSYYANSVAHHFGSPQEAGGAPPDPGRS